ncbi:cell surface glycoprotein MUC18 isoform X1 [Pipistrellus kuhlii]|uniref:cell surface glycoprotein MUC18 isoform X1 n=1 Tax=Pipistrellus kuhlii TaxID=59472 RepID=UPI00174F3516|nr:cell surface glycoprotein MUC18 isoform X1 [Pipistrellus kuhlii]
MRLLCALLLAACCRRAAGVLGEAEPPEPELVEVEVGSTALLRCGPSQAQGNLSYVDWFSVHREKPVLIFRVLQGQGHSVAGEYEHRLSLREAGAALALTHVTPHDERVFLCQAKPPGPGEHRLQLRVYKAPEEPSIQANTQGISVNSPEPEEVATCVGRNGYPVPQVVWYKNGQPLKEQKDRVHIQSSQTAESSGLYTLRSVLQAQLRKQDRDARFYCELSYRLPSGSHMKESPEVTVPVFYPAETVWLEVAPAGPLKEGDRVEIQCLADGNPPPHFSLSKQDPGTLELVEERTLEDGVLVLAPARREHSGRYQCQGLDLESSASLLSAPRELRVDFVSDVRVRPAAPEAHEGGNLTLTCRAESSQELEFQWLREETGKVLAPQSVLELQNLDREAGGGYRCVASAPRVPGLNATRLVSVAVFGPPWMALRERKVRAPEDALLNLTCVAWGHPRPTITWSVGGTASEQNQGPQGVLSLLSVRVTPQLVETGAQCVASNTLGRNSTRFLLELGKACPLGRAWAPAFPNLHPSLSVSPACNRSTGPSTATVGPHTRANGTTTEKKLPEPQSKGVVIAAVTVSLLVLALLGAVLCFFHKKGKLPCGRSGKQDITLPPSHKSTFVVEVKSDKPPEEMGLLQGSRADQRAPGDQGEKYIDLRH